MLELGFAAWKILEWNSNYTNAKQNTHTRESLTWQNIPASCLSFPSGQGPKSACSQSHPYKHPPSHTHSVCPSQQTQLWEDQLSHCALTLLSCPAEGKISEGGISRLTGCLLSQQHSTRMQKPNNWWWSLISLSGGRWKHPIISMSGHSADNGWPTAWKTHPSAVEERHICC